jgi:hypothetical protein
MDCGCSDASSAPQPWSAAIYSISSFDVSFISTFVPPDRAARRCRENHCETPRVAWFPGSNPSRPGRIRTRDQGIMSRPLKPVNAVVQEALHYIFSRFALHFW